MPLDLTVSGSCAPKCGGLTPYCNAKAHCVGCTGDAQCSLGQVCKVTSDTLATCTPGCMDDARCGTGKKCCNGSCIDPSSDSGNCGACGKVCTGQHASVSCVAGKCALDGKCDPGWGDCDMNPANGCEANLHIDPNNCTACAMKCAIPNAVQACADGCYEAACTFGFDDCNMDPKDGCETSVLSDGNNCGACGVSCSKLPHASAGCMNSGCVLGACDQGYFDCDGDPKNGCEVNLMNDAKNCARCGVTCPMNVPYCAMGVCQNGCVNGHPVPNVCMTGKDLETGDPWTVCKADCNSAWVSHDNMGGGKYHALQICQTLGYSQFGMHGGTCSNVCGYCEGQTGCMMNGNEKWDGGGLSGNDQFGVILGQTVQWQCLK